MLRGRRGYLWNVWCYDNGTPVYGNQSAVNRTVFVDVTPRSTPAIQSTLLTIRNTMRTPLVKQALLGRDANLNTVGLQLERRKQHGFSALPVLLRRSRRRELQLLLVRE